MLKINELNENKICFISCVTDDEKIKLCHAYIDALKCPPGMTKEYRAVRGVKSIAAGYQKAMESSEAKYKVYLHQDAWIVEPDFIGKVTDFFRAHPEAGIAGVVGSATMPADGRWWSGQKVGMIIDRHRHLFRNYFYNHGDCPAILLDGLALFTQYDLPWRADIFDKWHFYDVSQCLEFYRRGYKGMILPQRMPAFIHDCKINDYDDKYEGERQKFLREYAAELARFG